MTTSGELEVSNENSDGLSVFFLAEGEQTAESVMARLTSFISEAKQSLDFAVYDMRLDDPLKNELTAALAERAKAGVEIRICYDGDKPLQPNLAGGQDPAPPGTGAFVQSLGYPWRRIAGMKLMHHKFIVRDRAAVWTGSLNLTNDAFTLMENNVVEINSATLADYYAHDFEQLWEKQNFESTGEIQPRRCRSGLPVQPATVRVMFSPGCGLAIDAEIAKRVRAAHRRVRICSLLINSGTLIGALLELLQDKTRKVDGIYDRTQMADVYRQWQDVPSNRWKIPAVQEIVARAGIGRKKFHAVHAHRPARFHAQQNPRDRRHRHHRLLQFFAQRAVQRRKHSVHRKRRAGGTLQRLHRSSDAEVWSDEMTITPSPVTGHPERSEGPHEITNDDVL